MGMTDANMSRDRCHRLKGKSAFVTGAGQGIGFGIAEALAEEGAAVTIAEINAETGKAAAESLRQAGHQAQFIQVDILEEEQIIAGVEAHTDAYGGLDILVNNAGRNQHYDASTMTAEEWERSLGLNLRGAWLCCKHALPLMAARQSGVIINIASVHATMTTYNFFPYNVAKSGLLGLTRSIALDWGKFNIRAVAVSPGWVRTQAAVDAFEEADDPIAEEQRVRDLHPIKRIGAPRDIGELAAFLASDAAAYITGTEIVIDGGLSARFAD